MSNNFYSSIVFAAQMNENTKRLLIVLLLVFIILVVLIGYIGLLVKHIMKIQGDKIETQMHDMVVTNVIKDKKSFKKIGFKKICRDVFNDLKWPFLMIVLGILILVIANVIYKQNGWTLDYWQYNDGNFSTGGSGINTLFIVRDFNAINEERGDPVTLSLFGLNFEIYKPLVVNKPHFSTMAIPAYLSAPLFLVGTIWYLYCAQAFIARIIRIIQRANSVYDKSLKNFNASKNVFEDKPVEKNS